jgi:hypothetical protein
MVRPVLKYYKSSTGTYSTASTKVLVLPVRIVRTHVIVVLVRIVRMVLPVRIVRIVRIVFRILRY